MFTHAAVSDYLLEQHLIHTNALPLSESLGMLRMIASLFWKAFPLSWWEMLKHTNWLCGIRKNDVFVSKVYWNAISRWPSAVYYESSGTSCCCWITMSLSDADQSQDTSRIYVIHSQSHNLPPQTDCTARRIFSLFTPSVTVWFTVLSLCSCKHVDFTRIATLFASGHVSSPLPVTFNVILGTDLLWYVQYSMRNINCYISIKMH